MSDLLEAGLPIVAAPMAGGPTTVQLVEAVTRAGGFGFLAAGNKTAEAMATEIEALRSRFQGARIEFGVNLFAPPTAAIAREAFDAYAARMQDEADHYGIELATAPATGDDEWREKVDMLTQHPVPVVSVTFGLPPVEDIRALQRAGSTVLATVTSPLEAIAASRFGVDGLTVQGYLAGGHSAVHDVSDWPQQIELVDLLQSVREVTHLPLIAAGGVDGPEVVRELLGAGAVAVAVGTMLLRTDEAGTSSLQRRCMTDERFTSTALSRAYTGRPARALRNGFVDRHGSEAPWGYPEVHYLTRPLRQAALRARDLDRAQMWAGTGFKRAPDGPADGVIAWLSSQAHTPIGRA